MGNRRIAVAVSLDVEEEGLFSGRYPSARPSLENIRYLEKLAPIFERGIRPTFFCAHCAFVQKAARVMLDKMRRAHSVEIGAHLHHWNTPRKGHDFGRVLTRPWTALLDAEDMRARMQTLLNAAKDYAGEPVIVFRMGRWDLHKFHWPLLKEMGIRFDASVRPLHSFTFPEGPDHYDSPADPYIVKVEDTPIREIPCTVTPLSRSVASLGICRTSLRKWGALALLPVEHPLWLMKLTTLAHLKRGGQTISLTWHSSELMPGGNPLLPDESSITRFIRKICAYLDWMEKKFALEYLTISETGQKYALHDAQGSGDWNFGASQRRKQ